MEVLGLCPITGLEVKLEFNWHDHNIYGVLYYEIVRSDNLRLAYFLTITGLRLYFWTSGAEHSSKQNCHELWFNYMQAPNHRRFPTSDAALEHLYPRNTKINWFLEGF